MIWYIFQETFNIIYSRIWILFYLLEHFWVTRNEQFQQFESCWFPQTCWMTQPDPISHLANLIEKKQCSKLQLPSVMHLYSFARDSHYGFRSWSPPAPAPFQKEINQQVTQLLDDSLWFQDRLWPTLTQHIEVLWGSRYTGNLHLYACLEGYGMFKWTNDALKDL